MRREEFVKLCKKVLEESSTYSMDSFKKLGISFNSWKVGSRIGDAYFTDSDEYRIQTQSSFIELWRRGLIYEDERINNYCPGCKTTIADAEWASITSDSLMAPTASCITVTLTFSLPIFETA